MSESDSKMVQDDGFSRGKEDGLLGRSKQPPEDDPEQSSLYDLGYSEGSIQHPFAQNATRPKDTQGK